MVYYDLPVVKASSESMLKTLIETNGRKIYNNLDAFKNDGCNDWILWGSPNSIGKEFHYIRALVTKPCTRKYVRSINSLGLLPIVFRYEYLDKTTGKKRIEIVNYNDKSFTSTFFKTSFAFLNGGFIEDFNPNFMSFYINNALNNYRTTKENFYDFNYLRYPRVAEAYFSGEAVSDFRKMQFAYLAYLFKGTFLEDDVNDIYKLSRKIDQADLRMSVQKLDQNAKE